MNLEKLQQLLASGAINQEEFDQLSKTIEEKPVEPSSEQTTEDKEATQDEHTQRMEKLIQSAIDRATNRLGNENKKLRDQLEKLKKEKLSDDELKTLEVQEKEAALAEREQQILDKENRFYAIEAIKKAGLDDGSTKALNLIDFVMSSDQSEIDKKIDTFKELVNSFVKAEIDKTFKANGKTPGKSSDNSGVDNPFSKSTFNLTRQMQLYAENPELARQLEQSAN